MFSFQILWQTIFAQWTQHKKYIFNKMLGITFLLSKFDDEACDLQDKYFNICHSL